MKMKKPSIFDNMPDSEKPDVNKEAFKRKRKEKWQSANRFMDRLFGFILVTVLILGSGALGFCYMTVKGPSDTFRKLFMYTFAETRRFDFINNLFYTSDEIAAMGLTDQARGEEIMTPTIDTSLITIAEEKTDVNGMDAYGLIDDDGDGIILQTVNFRGSTGYLIVVLDPTRVFLGTAQNADVVYGAAGMVLDDLVAKYGARGGINAGVFVDTSGAGSGWPPQGITISEGVPYVYDEYGAVGGLTEDGVFYCGYYSYADCVNLGLKNACSFGPVIIANGAKVGEEELSSGVNPRTCIGQRGDGAILMLVVDGRQAYSFGLSYSDCADLLLEYGCVNAINMDGGSSTCMYMDGELINHPSNQAGGTRYLPTAWLFK